GHISLRQRIKIDGQKGDRPTVRGRERGTQRWLVSHRQEDVDLARRKLAIACLVALDVRCLDVFEREVPAFLIAQFGYPLEESSVRGRRARLDPDKPPPQHLRLCLHREGPPDHGPAEGKNEVPASHSNSW